MKKHIKTAAAAALAVMLAAANCVTAYAAKNSEASPVSVGRKIAEYSVYAAKAS